MADEPPGRYKLPKSGETLHQPGSGDKVLLNKLGLTSKRDLDRAEFEALLRAQMDYLSILTTETRFTAELIRQKRRDWLGEIYAWAGEYRTVNLAKGGFAWPPALQVPQNMKVFEEGLLRDHTPCKPRPIRERSPTESLSFTPSCFSSTRFAMATAAWPGGWPNSWPTKRIFQGRSIASRGPSRTDAFQSTWRR